MLDLTKVPLNEYGHVQTRDGRPVKLFTTERVAAVGQSPVIGLIQDNNGELVASWRLDGRYLDDRHRSDLVPVPKRVHVERWLNVYPDGWTSTNTSREQADRRASRSRIACVRVSLDVTEGEGL